MARKSTARKESKYKPPPDFLRDNIQHMPSAQRFELMTGQTVRVGKYMVGLEDYWQAEGGGQRAGSFISPDDAIDKLEQKILED